MKPFSKEIREITKVGITKIEKGVFYGLENRFLRTAR